MKILCWLGLHWRITVDRTLFVDRVSGNEVYEGTCSCGRKWMHDSVFGFPTFKVEKKDVKEAADGQ